MHLSFPQPAAGPTPSRAARDVTDAEAIHGVLTGRREMFEIIVRRYNAQLYRTGMAYLRDHAQTEDAMQNTYLKAFLKLERFEGTAAFPTWLTRIMINECLMLIRGRKRRPDGFPGSETAEVASDLPPASALLDAQDVKALLEQSISRLPRLHRAVYLLREVQQLSTAETARCLGLSPAHVKVTLHRAREGLKARLLRTSEGVELFDYAAPRCDPMTAKVMAAIHAAR
jgi:RNA polymerase sigma-70 factor (ECF subfamily)